MLFVTSDEAGAASVAQSLSDALSSDDAVVEVRLTASYPEAYHALCDGTAQVVSLGAFASLAAMEAGCGEALYVLEQDGSLYTQGQMITAVGRNVFTVEGFRGRTFCRPDAYSTQGWIVPSLVMRAHRLDPFKDLVSVTDAGSDEDVVNMIFTRECDVGATVLGAEIGIDNPSPARSGRILVVEELPPVPNDSILLSFGVNPGIRALLLDLLRESEDDMAVLLGADSLVEVENETFGDLLDLFEAAGIEAAALAE
jgi:ABC-type phosphate/phosphonate transport system substrate-binding protein